MRIIAVIIIVFIIVMLSLMVGFPLQWHTCFETCDTKIQNIFCSKLNKKCDMTPSPAQDLGSKFSKIFVKPKGVEQILFWRICIWQDGYLAWCLKSTE